MRVGFAEIEISECADLHKYSLHDPLKASVAWIDDGQSPFLMVTLDYIEMFPKDVRTLKDAVQEAVGIPPGVARA